MSLLRDASGLGNDLGIDLVIGLVDVPDAVVDVVEFDQMLSQFKGPVTKPAVRPHGQVPRWHHAGHDAHRQRANGCLLAAATVLVVVGEADVVKRRLEKLGHVFVGVTVSGPGQHAQCQSVEAGHEKIAGSIDDFGSSAITSAPERGCVPHLRQCRGSIHSTMIAERASGRLWFVPLAADGGGAATLPQITDSRQPQPRLIEFKPPEAGADASKTPQETRSEVTPLKLATINPPTLGSSSTALGARPNTSDVVLGAATPDPNTPQAEPGIDGPVPR